MFYLGEIPEISFTQQDLFDALNASNLSAPGEVSTIGPEMFGPDKDIPVVKLEPTLLLRAQKSTLRYNLRARGIEDASSYANDAYRPHVTLQNPDQKIPESITLGAPQVWWGNERITEPE